MELINANYGVTLLYFFWSISLEAADRIGNKTWLIHTATTKMVLKLYCTDARRSWTAWVQQAKPILKLRWLLKNRFLVAPLMVNVFFARIEGLLEALSVSSVLETSQDVAISWEGFLHEQCLAGSVCWQNCFSQTSFPLLLITTSLLLLLHMPLQLNVHTS